MQLKRRGFFPRGGGEIEIRVPRLHQNNALALKGIDVRSGSKPLKASVNVLTAGQFQSDGEKMCWIASKILKKVRKPLSVIDITHFRLIPAKV